MVRLVVLSTLLSFGILESPVSYRSPFSSAYRCGWSIVTTSSSRSSKSRSKQHQLFHCGDNRNVVVPTATVVVAAAKTSTESTATRRTTLLTMTTTTTTDAVSNINATTIPMVPPPQQQCAVDDTIATTVSWDPNNMQHIQKAKLELHVWPLDIYNAKLLNEVHPYNYTTTINTTNTTTTTTTTMIYDIVAIGSGAGGLVTSKQSARRGARSALISAHLAGGDCLNVGCVPSKGLLRAAKAIREVKRASEFGIRFINQHSDNDDDNNSHQAFVIDFPAIMSRMRKLRSVISPVDGHVGTTNTGATVYQGYGKFTSPNTIQVVSSSGGDTISASSSTTKIQFRKAVIATGGRPAIPSNIPGLLEAPYTTNEILFNLETLPPRMIVLGAGIVALEMAQCFATFGAQVTVIQRSKSLFASTFGDPEAAQLLQTELEESGVHFIQGSIKSVTTLRERNMDDTTQQPLMSVSIEDTTNSTSGKILDLECECLLIAIGRVPNVENIDLEKANVQYEIGKGVVVNDNAQSITNPNVYAVGDCVAGVPRLTHMSGEMAKLVVQNSLFRDDWKLSSLVVPAVMYTEPEYATAGMSSMEMAAKNGISVDMYRTGLEHNDRAILESSNRGFVKIFCRQGTDEIVGTTIVAERAGEMINEVTLAMKNHIGLRVIGRNIHSYPTSGEAVMGCGIQYINANWERFNETAASI